MLRVETDPMDLSSEFGGLSECEMVVGIVNDGDFCGEGLTADHFLVVW